MYKIKYKSYSYAVHQSILIFTQQKISLFSHGIDFLFPVWNSAHLIAEVVFVVPRDQAALALHVDRRGHCSVLGTLVEIPPLFALYFLK